MRIALVTPEFVTEPYYCGGLASYLGRLSRSLAEQGHEVHVLVPSIVYDTIRWHEVTVHRVGYGRANEVLDRLTFHRLTRACLDLEFAWKAYRKLRELQTRRPLDIVQCANSTGCGLFAAAFLKTPVITRLSCYRPAWNKAQGTKRDLNRRTEEALECLQLRISRRVFAPSRLLCEMVMREAGVRDACVIRTPFALSDEQEDDSVYRQFLLDRSYLLFFGRLQLNKGIHVLADALPAVLKANEDCTAAIVGMDFETRFGPSMRDYVREQCREFHDRLVFVDEQRHSSLYPIIRNARLCVLPSVIDNLPNSLLESMALGTVVVGTAGASFDEVIIDGKDGFLVPVGDADALADKINKAWVHPKLESIRAEALETVKAFSPEHTVSELLAFYRDVLAAPSLGTHGRGPEASEARKT